MASLRREECSDPILGGDSLEDSILKRFLLLLLAAKFVFLKMRMALFVSVSDVTDLKQPIIDCRHI